METGVTITNEMTGGDAYRPRVDETPVPCDHYSSTNCVYVSDDVESGYLGLGSKEALTGYLNALICRMKEQDREIRKLSNEIKRLKRWQ